MNLPDPHLQICLSKDFEMHAQQIVDAFSKKNVVCPPPDVQLVHHSTKAEYASQRIRVISGPVYNEKAGDAFKIHLCHELMSGISRIALEGWLEHEMALCGLLRHPEHYECNFMRQIFPLMPVTGSAESVMRELTGSLENGLRRYMAVQTLLAMDNGSAQVSFYFFKLAPEPEDPLRYKKAERYSWIRALILCGKLKDFMPVHLLAEKHMPMARDLEAFWWKLHEYLLPKDRAVLKSLAEEPAGKDPKQYSEMIVEMFKLVKAQYLNETKAPKMQMTLH